MLIESMKQRDTWNSNESDIQSNTLRYNGLSSSRDTYKINEPYILTTALNISESKNWITTDKISESADRSKTAEYSESVLLKN